MRPVIPPNIPADALVRINSSSVSVGGVSNSPTPGATTIARIFETLTTTNDAALQRIEEDGTVRILQ